MINWHGKELERLQGKRIENVCDGKYPDNSCGNGNDQRYSTAHG